MAQETTVANATRAAASGSGSGSVSEFYGSEFYASARGSEFYGSEFNSQLNCGEAVGGCACRGGSFKTHWPSAVATPENG